MKMKHTPKEERLKHWHIRCMSCDCLVKRFKKEEIHEEHLNCPDCKEDVDVYIGVTIPYGFLFGKSQKTIINCNIVHG